MDRTVFTAWLEEPSTIQALSDGNEKVLFVDTALGHDFNEELKQILQAMKTTIVHFVPKAKNLVQPADLSVIEKFKDAWRNSWELYKLSCTRENALD